VRRLTLDEVNKQHGGKLPPDATLRADDEADGPAPSPRAKSRTRSDRFAVLNAFVDFGIANAELKPAEALVWFMLFRDTKGDGTARTGQADIGRRARLDVRTVRRAVASLKLKGLLEVVRRGQLNAGPSVYRVRPIACS
jgi:hypothetical protein